MAGRGKCHKLSNIVLESTGGLEIPLANPRQTHQFSISKSLAKDAKMLASYVKMLEFDGEVAKQLYIPPTLEMEQFLFR